MFKPEEQQLQICLLKSSLEEIENELIVQRSALPALDAENEQKYRETMTALQISRSLNTEIERLKLENVRLTAKRMQLKRQSDDNARNLERSRDTRAELADKLDAKEKEIEYHIRNYEDFMQEIADRFRKTRGYYNEEEMNSETEKIKVIIAELEGELEKRQTLANKLKQQLDNIQPNVPEDLLNIIGKINLENEKKSLEAKYDVLMKKLNSLQNKRNI